MCVVPAVGTAIALGVTTVASTTANVVAQAKGAKAQAKAINAQLGIVAEENRMATSAEIFERDRSMRREQARIRTAAGEAGLGLNSGSVETLLLDSAMQASLANGRSLANRESRDTAAKAEAKSQMSRVQKPTALGAGIQIGASVAQAGAGIATARARAKAG